MNTACVKAAEPDCVAEADCGPGFECAAGACVPTGDGPGDDGEGSDDGGGRGCSVNDSAAPPSGLWLLLLGVVLVVRRTHWQGTR